MNNLFTLLQIARNGGNPMQMLGQMASQDPKLQQAMKLIQGKNLAQLRQTAENIAKERGLSIEEVAQKLGIK